MQSPWLLAVLCLVVLLVGRRIMTKLDDANAKLDTILETVGEIADDLAEVITGNVDGASGPQLDAFNLRLDGIVTRLRTIADVVPEPVVEPPPV